MWKKIRVYVFSFIILLVMLLAVLVWNKIINKDEKTDDTVVDVSDVDNTKFVDAKLGDADVKITQSYLKNYTVHKQGTWYASKAYVKKIKYDDNDAIITLSENKDSNDTITAYISKDKCNVKIGNEVFFTGTVSIRFNAIMLSRISVDEQTKYSSQVDIDFKDLQTNMVNINKTYFLIYGYLVTDGDKYKLYDSKEAYNKNPEAGEYFLISWNGEFPYTGNQDVNIRCRLEDTYKIKECTYVK